jgi:hypothetical protein
VSIVSPTPTVRPPAPFGANVIAVARMIWSVGQSRMMVAIVSPAAFAPESIFFSRTAR